MTATRPPFWQAFVDHEELLEKKRAERSAAARPVVAAPPIEPDKPERRSLRDRVGTGRPWSARSAWRYGGDRIQRTHRSGSGRIQIVTIEDVLARLLAGLEKDERIATATSGTSAEREWVYAEGRVSDTGEYGGLHAETHDPRDGVHIARHDPDRVLRHVEAIRKVIAERDRLAAEGAARDNAFAEATVDGIEIALAILAGIYTEPAEGAAVSPPPGLNSFPRRAVGGVDPNKLVSAIMKVVYEGGEVDLQTANYLAGRATSDLFVWLVEELNEVRQRASVPPLANPSEPADETEAT
ncbi:DUF6221 family protein [Nocardia vulneris]|uniref:Uncharacterized protein n=1 Tax=Nocardia vulneris TaxID=1141657 RepID=A0ABR4ZDD5_9NOCA|nr:DUF6221 family protein [Nocardia vulneris]KIA63019.1 hypothetical protein FG87_21895 [Nocardia vulneris]